MGDHKVSICPEGHEIVGKISSVGKMVNHLKTGQRVGVGWGDFVHVRHVTMFEWLS